MQAELSFHISATSGVPIYQQIVDQVERLIGNGQVRHGALVPAINNVAKQLAINPVSVSRAYKVLAEKGVLVRNADGQLQISISATQPEPVAEPPFLERGPYLFISYSHNDRAIVAEEIRQIQEMGLNVWYDDGISPGASWDEEIAAALSQCTLFVYFITPNSVASQHCRNEVNFCLSRNIRILSVYLEPTQLPPGLELNLSAIQAISQPELGVDRYRQRLRETLLTYFPIPGHITTHESALAVLPLENHTGDERKQFLSDSLAESLITALSALEGLNVLPKQDAFHASQSTTSLKELGQQLGADRILYGSIQASASRIRVTVNLTGIQDGNILWSERLEGNADDLFSLEDNLIEAVLSRIQSQSGTN